MAGALDVAATTLLLVAVRHGTHCGGRARRRARSPVTVVLAWALLKEHISRLQFGGLMIALTALVLIAAG